MATSSAGSVVLVRFPFSDLSSSKVRPAVVLAASGNDDWILCQVTSNPYADQNAVRLDDECFLRGSLQRVSFARPGKLFTANASLFCADVGALTPEALSQIRGSVTSLLNAPVE